MRVRAQGGLGIYSAFEERRRASGAPRGRWRRVRGQASQGSEGSDDTTRCRVRRHTCAEQGAWLHEGQLLFRAACDLAGHPSSVFRSHRDFALFSESRANCPSSRSERPNPHLGTVGARPPFGDDGSSVTIWERWEHGHHLGVVGKVAPYGIDRSTASNWGSWGAWPPFGSRGEAVPFGDD